MLCSLPMKANGEQVRLQCPSKQSGPETLLQKIPGSVKTTEVRDLGNMLNNYVVSHGSDEESVF